MRLGRHIWHRYVQLLYGLGSCLEKINILDLVANASQILNLSLFGFLCSSPDSAHHSSLIEKLTKTTILQKLYEDSFMQLEP